MLVGPVPGAVIISAIPYPTEPVPLDDQGHLNGDLPCLGCGYNLRGLSPEGVCPECATPVGRSQYGNLLRYSNPDWVEQLASGMNWLVASIVLGIVLGILAGGLGAAFRGVGGAQLGMTLVSIGASIISLIAYWKVTTPDPSQTETGLTARQLVRVLVLVTFTVGIAVHGLMRLDPRIAAVVSGLNGLAGVAQFFATFIYARQLAMRIPDRKLADRTRLVMWGLVITLGCVMAMTLFFAAIAGARGGPAGTAAAGAGFLMCGGGVGVIVFAIWSLLLIDRYRRAFRDAAQRARSTWLQATPPTVPG